MEAFQLNPISLTSLLSLSIIIITIFLWSIKQASNRRRLPPSPLKLPIIGNLHQIGSLPHHTITSLARKHGPLMLLHFGSVPVLIVSSADSAREIMKTHDIIFANRPPYKAFKKLFYGCRNVATASYGEYWRQMKSMVVLQLLSSKRVQSFRRIREEEIEALVKKIEGCCGAVNLSEMFVEFTSDMIGRSAFGRRYSETENGNNFLHAMHELMELLVFVNIGDFIPWLDWIGRVNGFDRRLDRTAKEMDEVFESMIQERLEVSGREEMGECFLDVLVEIYKGNTEGFSIDRDSLKSIILDVFVAGTDTLSTVLEWMMSELLRHPTILKKLQDEVRGVVKHKHNITDDMEKMHYLKAVIKETLRYHPPAPIFAPRMASKDVQIKGFDISAGTLAMINALAIGRDPESWDEPEKFMPERFLNSSRDFRGQDFEFIPFGAGRRGCPGITFSLPVLDLVMANLMHKFDWKLPAGVEGKDLDMSESCGIVVHRDIPLLAFASRT